MGVEAFGIGDLLWGPLLHGGQWPLNLRVVLGDLRPRFLPKGQAGRGFRAIARNGRVLLASALPLVDWIDRAARLRIQTWNKFLLPHEPPRPYGVLLCFRPAAELPGEAEYDCSLTSRGVPAHLLEIDVGGRTVMAVTRRSRAQPAFRAL